MITHSTTPAGYELKAKGGTYALVTKEVDGSFSITGGEAFHDATQLNHPTMAALKAYLEPLVPETMTNPPPVPGRLTYDAIKGGYGGHSRAHAAVEMARQLWPEQRNNLQWIYAFVLRRSHELMAMYAWGRDSKRWLEQNPTVGAYDYAEFTRRVESAYGPQPDWTH